MPVLKSRHPNAKVWRPRGTRYAQQRTFVEHDDFPFVERAIQTAVEGAMLKFVEEFGRRPDLERIVIEVVGATALVDVTIFELPKEVA